MKHSLRRLSFQTKLLASFFIVILLATAAGYLFINQSVNRAFTDFAGRSFTLQDQVLVGLIVQYYNRTGSLDGLVDFLERGPGEIPILLVDPDREVVFAPEAQFVGRKLSENQLEGGQSILLASGEIWTVVPYRSLVGRNALEQRFLEATRAAVWFAAFAASAAALILSLFLVRQTTNPLRQLEAATQRIAQGDFDERVEIRSSDEIGHLAEAFNEMARSLKLSEEAKRRMIADISHELRTPLAAVRSALEGLRDGLFEPSSATFASLHDRVLLLTRLVGDLHQLALADAGQLSIERQATRLDAIVEGIVETVGFQIEDSGLTLETAIDPAIPALLIDENRIEQVLLNLLANAIRHTPEGGRIELRADRTSDSEVTLSVCDTGSGLAPEDVDHIFERFYCADPAREGAGAGLGLSIAKALVEAHGGKIRAENRPQGGACFKIVLPIATA
jgi:signal transduction histidine kinase